MRFEVTHQDIVSLQAALLALPKEARSHPIIESLYGDFVKPFETAKTTTLEEENLFFDAQCHELSRGHCLNGQRLGHNTQEAKATLLSLPLHPLLKAFIAKHTVQSSEKNHAALPFNFATPALVMPYMVGGGDGGVLFFMDNNINQLTLQVKKKVVAPGNTYLYHQLSNIVIAAENSQLVFKDINITLSREDKQPFPKVLQSAQQSCDFLLENILVKKAFKLPLFKHEALIFKQHIKKAYRFMNSFWRTQRSKANAYYRILSLKNASNLKEQVLLMLLAWPKTTIKGLSAEQLRKLSDTITSARTAQISLAEKKVLNSLLLNSLLKYAPKKLKQAGLIPTTEANLSSESIRLMLKSKHVLYSKAERKKKLTDLYVKLAIIDNNATVAKRLLQLPVEETGWRKIPFLNQLFPTPESHCALYMDPMLCIKVLTQHQALSKAYIELMLAEEGLFQAFEQTHQLERVCETLSDNDLEALIEKIEAESPGAGENAGKMLAVLIRQQESKQTNILKTIRAVSQEQENQNSSGDEQKPEEITSAAKALVARAAHGQATMSADKRKSSEKTSTEELSEESRLFVAKQRVGI